MGSAARTKMALDDSRTLILGAQILFGFLLETPFQPRFIQFSALERGGFLVALGLSVITIALLIAPGARHRIVEKGEPTREFNRYVSSIALASLLVFDCALACQIFVIASVVINTQFAFLSASAAAFIGAILWFGPYVFKEREAVMQQTEESAKPEEKVEFALTEARVVLPGAQALLGFQFIAVLTDAFERLPFEYRIAHGVALACIVVSTMLLLTPAAYHRIVYGGEAKPGFYQIATRYILGATIFLAAGIALDMMVIGALVTGQDFAARAIAAVAFGLLIVMWFIWPMIQRSLRTAYRTRLAGDLSDHTTTLEERKWRRGHRRK